MSWKLYRRERIELLEGKLAGIRNTLRIAMLPGSVASQEYTRKMQRCADEIARLQGQLSAMREQLARWRYDEASMIAERDLAIAEMGFLRQAKDEEQVRRASRDAAAQVLEMRRLMGS